MNGGRAVRRALAGALLIAGALSVSALTAPIVREGPRGALPGQAVATEGSITGLGDALQEVRRTGPGFAPDLLGIDDGFLMNGSLLHSELRERILAPHRAGSAGGPDPFSEIMDNALRTTRDAFFDSADTASFSVAGVELSVTVRGDRRSLSVAGLELLGARPENGMWQVPVETTSAPTLPGALREGIALGQRYAGEGESRTEGSSILLEVKKFVANPMTIVGVIALAGVWLLLVAAERGRRS